MRLTEAQRAELERREWRPEVECGEFQTWAKISGGCIATLYADGFFTFSGDPSLAAEFLAVAEYQPPGYRLVPEEVLRNAVQVCDMHINLARIACNVDVTPLVRHTRAALASALQGEEIEKR